MLAAQAKGLSNRRVVFTYAARNALLPQLQGFGLALGFVAGTVGLLGHALGANTFIIVRIMEPFWFFAAIVVALPGLPDAEPVAEPVPVARLSRHVA